MKVALIHDSFSEFGGAEKVSQEIIKIFPKISVFTSYYDQRIVKNNFPNLEKNLKFSWFQNFPHKTTTTIQLLSPLIWRFKELKNFDLIITSSAYYLCPLATLNLSLPTLHYLHTLPKNLFGLEEKSFWQKNLSFSWQKNLYLKSLKKASGLMVNSQNTQEKVKKITGLKSTVVYPPVETPLLLPSEEKKEYYLIVSRIDDAKGLEIAVKACNTLNLPLKIAGATNNPLYLEKLKNLAGKSIEFLGFVSEEEKKKLYQKARAFLFCSKDEDFGIAPIEAMAHGVPVIAYFGGGAKETVIEEKTGIFFHQHSWQSIAEAIMKFKTQNFDSNIIYKSAQRFNQNNFRKNLLNYLKEKKIIL
jgi:glycosyltransferase involved in cell wall biosynthesis